MFYEVTDIEVSPAPHRARAFHGPCVRVVRSQRSVANSVLPVPVLLPDGVLVYPSAVIRYDADLYEMVPIVVGRARAPGYPLVKDSATTGGNVDYLAALVVPHVVGLASLVVDCAHLRHCGVCIVRSHPHEGDESHQSEHRHDELRSD